MPHLCCRSAQGLRVVGLATKEFAQPLVDLSPEDELGMLFRGFLAFLDPPKASAIPSICQLCDKGVAIKVHIWVTSLNP
jgi:Mg2+-importing ATPase